MNLLIYIPDDFQEEFENDRLRNMFGELIHYFYTYSNVSAKSFQLLKALISSFDEAIPVNIEYRTSMTKSGEYISEQYASWDAEAEERLNKESTILKFFDLQEQNEKLKELLSKMIYCLSDPATTNIDKIKTCFGYDLDKLLGEDWREKL